MGSPVSAGAAVDDCSPSSAESSFRELDDVFLQTQTRIWLGEVLQTRLNEQLNIADLLADGELLFEVSKEVWKMLLMKRLELRGGKAHKQEPFLSRKSSGKYRPYSNVDSFLKICKILGLTGIDIFSPSDVVEKRDTRKVCMCIRSLSKKARSRQLNVPDFDIVTYTVAMPTDMVGGIRRSWELSHCSPSSSTNDGPYPITRRQSRKVSNAASGRYNDWYSEESDDNFVLQSDSSTVSCSYNSSSHMDAELGDSEEVSSLPVFISHETFSSDAILHEGEDCNFHTCANTGSYVSKAARRNLENEFRSGFSDVDDVEVSSIASMNSISGAVQKLEFNDLMDEEVCFKNEWFPDSPNYEIDLVEKKRSVESKYQERIVHETQGHGLITANEGEFLVDMKVKDSNFSGRHFEPPSDVHYNNGLDNDGIRMSRVNSSAVHNEGKVLFVGQPCFSFGFHQWDQKGKCRITTPRTRNDDHEASSISLSHLNSDKDTVHFIQAKATGDTNTAHSDDDGKQENSQSLEGKNLEEIKDLAMGKSEHNKQRRLLINSVIRGTAVLGTLLLFLHFRKNFREETGKSDKQSARIRKANAGNFSTQNRWQENTMVGLYPAEKLRFRN